MMKTIFKKYIRTNWYYINRKPIFILSVFIFFAVYLLSLLNNFINFLFS